MSRLKELIQEYCPDGVEYKKLGEVIRPVSNIKWKDISIDKTFQYIDLSSVDRETNKITSTINISSENAPSRAQQIVIKDDVLFGGTRPMLKRYCLVPECNDGQICSTGFTVLRADNNHVLPGYLYHCISTNTFFDYVKTNQRGASYPAISDVDVKKYSIPVPPLSVQQEIVRILDSFSNLEQELEQELEQRKKQYDFYSNLLLKNQKDVQHETIEDICVNISSGGTPNSHNSNYYGGDIPWLRTQEVNFNEIKGTGVTITEEGLENSSAKWIPENSVIVAMYGATVGRTAYTAIPLTTNQACCNLEIDPNKALYKYVYYWLANEYEYIKSLGQGSQTNINAKVVKNLRIDIPSLERQQKIVDTLDAFNSICTSLTSGLPAEISLRKKQYEYYRDRLLSFPRKA